MITGVGGPLAARESQGEGKLDVPRKLGILALLGPLDVVPKRLAVVHPGRGVSGGQDLRVGHFMLGLPGGTEEDAASLIQDRDSGPVASLGHDRRPVREFLG